MAPSIALTIESGFFSAVFRVCTAYLTYGPCIRIQSDAWHHGNWRWYFTSLDETSAPPDMSFMDVPLDVPRWTLGDYRQAIRTVFRLSPPLRQDVRQCLAKIGGPFTALFVRRGDKVVREAPLRPVAEILSSVRYDDSTVFFVQTDDFTVVEDLRALLPTHTIHSTVPPTKRGSYHSRLYPQSGYVPWSEKSPEEARTETTEMLVGLSVCLAATECWTDDTSNVGRFLKLMDDRVHVYPTDYSVDESDHQHPAWTLRAEFLAEV